ncbi:MAG: hypothetical protein IJR47_02505, partial [Clostridia bacterium]|nr:hypothetical protein [Clostridia bacterium]
MKTTKKLTALMAAFIFAFAFAVVKPEKVQAAEYQVTLTGVETFIDGYTSFKLEEGKKLPELSAEKNLIPEGQYIAKLVDEDTNEEIKTNTFTMPARNVKIKAVYADATDYVIDLTSGTAIVDVSLGDDCPFIDPFGKPFRILQIGDKLDLNNDGKDDVEVIAREGNDRTFKSLDSGITEGKLDAVGNTHNFIFKFAPVNSGGNTGGNTNPANDGVATTGETPADPKNVDPNKAPKTGESNAF